MAMMMESNGNTNNGNSDAVVNGSTINTVDTLIDDSPNIPFLSLHNPCVQADLKTLTLFAKNDLFPRVRFIHDENSLKIGERPYKLFVQLCSDKLRGLQDDFPQEFKKLYINFIWSHGTSGRSNRIQWGLTKKRSGIYTYMNNKFIGT